MAKYRPYDAPYWHRRWEREDSQGKRKKIGKLDYDQIVSAAYDYMYAYGVYMRAAKDRTISREKVDDAYHQYDKYYTAFWTVCMVTGIPQAVGMAASRIGDKYYNDHGGTLCVDNERLIRSLM